MIITVTSFKGGVGKTTTAVHLAAFFQGHAPTVLIDADPNRSALGWSRRGDLPFPVVDEWHTDHLQGDYRHVIIDTQARPTPTDLAMLLRHCHLLVLPTTPDVLALEALVLTVDHLERLPNPQRQIQYQILLAAVPPKPSRAGEEVRSLLAEAQLPTFDSSIRRYAAFQKAAQAGVPVYAVKDGKAELAWQDYQAVGQEILAAGSGEQ